MHILSNNPMWEAFGLRALAHTACGGADLAECFATLARIGDGTTEDWYREWTRMAERVYAIARNCELGGHWVSAREAYFRASTYFHVSYFPLFGAPTDPWLADAYRQEADAFRRAAVLSEFPIEPVEVPFESSRLPGYFVRPQHGAVPAPTLLHLNGYDANIHEMYFAHASAAMRRGYNCLLLDGPGQGRNLICDGMTLRPDSEAYVRPAVDFLLTRPEVDPQRIVLAGWSFGSYLAARAAAHENRIAALIADPGLWDPKVDLSTLAPELSAQAEVLDEALFAALEEKLSSRRADQMLRWRILQRGFWVHGVSSLLEMAQELNRFEISSAAGRITCPTLVTACDGDPLSKQADTLYEALGCRKKLLRFSAAQSAGSQCQALGRALHHQRVFDWLDETLQPSRTAAVHQTDLHNSGKRK